MSHVKRSVRAGVLVLAAMTFYGCIGNAWQSQLDSVLPQYQRFRKMDICGLLKGGEVVI